MPDEVETNPKPMRRSVPDMGKPAFNVPLTKAEDVMTPEELAQMHASMDNLRRMHTPRGTLPSS